MLEAVASVWYFKASHFSGGYANFYEMKIKSSKKFITKLFKRHIHVLFIILSLGICSSEMNVLFYIF
jgi:hypothetical protein